MALIKCVECEKEFSDQTDFCPNCGCPKEIKEEKKKEKKEKNPIGKKKILIIGVLCSLVVCGIFAYMYLNKEGIFAGKKIKEIDKVLSCIDDGSFHSIDETRYNFSSDGELISYSGTRYTQDAGEVSLLNLDFQKEGNNPKKSLSLLKNIYYKGISINELKNGIEAFEVNGNKPWTCTVLRKDQKNSKYEEEKEYLALPAIDRFKKYLRTQGYNEKGNEFSIAVKNSKIGVYKEVDFDEKTYSIYAENDDGQLLQTYEWSSNKIDYTYKNGGHWLIIVWDLDSNRWNCNASLNGWCNRSAQQIVDEDMIDVRDEFQDLINVAKVDLNDIK